MPATAVLPQRLALAPVADAYRRMAAASPYLRMEVAERPGPGGDWVRARRLAEDPDAVATLVAAEERRIRETYGVRPRPDVAPTWVLHRYAFTAALAMSGPWYLERRVPLLAADGVTYGWRTRRLVVAPGTETVAASAGAVLEAELRAAVAAHLAPVLEAFQPLVRRGERGMWALVTDALAQGLWHLGRGLGDPWAAARAADALLPGGTAPLPGAAAFRPDPAPEAGGEPTRTRVSCCLLYTVRPEEVCATCPRRMRRTSV
ncbi:(2Fe-2S)-binding protein [Streptomyces sp. NPDC003036]|uniref:(2Fe-2S)-binding protein n=1 Tax=Streptomyces sp. NPDC003036 TaxID=3154442 RepID=UPI0033B70DA1